MSLLTSLVSAFKGGGGARVPVSRGFVSPWSHWGATAFDGGPPGRGPFDYAREVGQAYLANPVAQRAVRIVAEGVGSAPIAYVVPPLSVLVGLRRLLLGIGRIRSAEIRRSSPTNFAKFPAVSQVEM